MDELEARARLSDHVKPVLFLIEKRPDISDIKLETNEEPANLKLWEQTNNCLLPNDLKSFYQLTDGFTLTWSYNLNDSTKLPLGKMSINCLAKLKRVFPSSKISSSFKTSELYLQQDSVVRVDTGMKFGDHHMIFELDSNDSFGKVVLVIKKLNLRSSLPITGFYSSESNSCICFIDRSLTIHHLADNFSAYFNLMMAHLGLPGWQYAFTSIGLNSQARLWIQLFCPARLKIDENSLSDEEMSRKQENEPVKSTKKKYPISFDKQRLE